MTTFKAPKFCGDCGWIALDDNVLCSDCCGELEVIDAADFIRTARCQIWELREQDRALNTDLAWASFYLRLAQAWVDHATAALGGTIEEEE